MMVSYPIVQDGCILEVLQRGLGDRIEIGEVHVRMNWNGSLDLIECRLSLGRSDDMNEVSGI